MIHAKPEPDVMSQKTHTLAAVPTAPEVVQVTDDERDHLARTTELLVQDYGSVDAPAFRRMLPALAGHYLPERGKSN